MKNPSNTKTKGKVVNTVNETIEVKSLITVKYILSLPFKICYLPFYAIYIMLFEVPSVPSRLVGLFRFAVFVLIGLNDRIITNFVNNTILKLELPNTCSVIILGIYGLIMIFNVFLSFLEIFGFHDPIKSGYSYQNSNISKYDAFDEALEHRDSLLRAKHTPDKIEELRKTGFMTKDRLFSMASPEVDEALELANAKMRAMHTPDKYKFLKGMFGGNS